MATPVVLTPELVERGYNNRAAVPDHPVFIERYVAQSRAAVDALGPRLDVRYGRGPKETLDLFLPAGTPRGTFAFLHGGYWRAFDKSDFSYVAPPFVAQGLAVAVINYDLCPQVSMGTIVDEIARAIAFLVRDERQLHTPRLPLVVAGHSAGGHLAAMMHTLQPAALGAATHPVRAAVSLSGLHDLAPMLMSSYNADLHLDQAQVEALSPVLRSPQTDAPVLLAVGAGETAEFLRQTDLLWDAWPAQRPPGATAPMRIAGRHHFDVVLDYGDADSALTRATLALF
jgi:arylformamidase